MRVKETTPGAEQATVEPARLLIADDHPIFRQGLKRIIEDLPDIQLVAEAESGDSALAQLRHLKPDLALIDVHLETKRAGADVILTYFALEAARSLS